MSNEQQVRGTMDDAKGKVKEGVGKVTGDEQMENEGKVDQAKGQIDKTAGDVREDVGKGMDKIGDAFKR